jgi:hypothetical protein
VVEACQIEIDTSRGHVRQRLDLVPRSETLPKTELTGELQHYLAVTTLDTFDVIVLGAVSREGIRRQLHASSRNDGTPPLPRSRSRE